VGVGEQVGSGHLMYNNYLKKRGDPLDFAYPRITHLIL
jgi:hypothetical protein